MHKTPVQTEELTRWHPLPGLAQRDPWLTQGPDARPGRVMAWFNASSVVHEGKRWMAYRTECRRFFLWSRISLVELDQNFQPVPGTNQILPLETRFDGWGAEDPKMFVFQGCMYVSYGDGYRVMLAQLYDSGRVARCGPVPSDVPDQSPPQAHPRQKNFGFFELDGRLFCQQDVSPAVTWEFDPRSWKVIDRQEHLWRWKSPCGHRLHGASPPVLHDGLLWRWVHTHRQEALPSPRKSWWQSKPVTHANRYYPHLVAFRPEPPFEPVAVGTRPVFFSPWEPADQPCPPTWHSVAYIGSAERENDGWRLFYGENDCRIVTAHVTDQEANATLGEAPAPVRRKVRARTQGFLHFIWMQGVDRMPEEDVAAVRQWNDMNPDWRTSVWDRDLLGSVIAEKAPLWEKSWAALMDQIDADPANVSLLAKASDLGRLILLSIRFGENQGWNAYADTDTTPHRPLTEFLADDQLYGANMGKNPLFGGEVSQKDWDSDNFDFIVPQENLSTRVPGYLTNAIMLARPGAVAISAILKAGMLTRSRPTLKAFGPIMLRQTVDALRRTVDGRRIEVLPYHYLVWNQRQTQMVRPRWTVASHHNSFRWKQDGVPAAHLGSARKQALR